MTGPKFYKEKSLLLLEFKVGGEHIIDQVVKVGAINQPLSLVAWVHGGPAELVIRQFPLHEAPHWSAHHRHRLLVGHDQDLTDLIKFNSLAEELACKGKESRHEYCPPSTNNVHNNIVKQHIIHTCTKETEVP